MKEETLQIFGLEAVLPLRFGRLRRWSNASCRCKPVKEDDTRAITREWSSESGILTELEGLTLITS